MMAEEMAVRLAETDARSKSNMHRLDTVEKRVDDLGRLTTAMEVMATEKKHQTAAMGEIKENVASLDSKVEAVEKKPAKRWEAVVEKLLIAAGADSCELESRRRIYRQSMRLYPDEPDLAEALMLSGLSGYSGESPEKTALWLRELKIGWRRKILDDLHGRFGYNFEPEQILNKISEDN